MRNVSIERLRIEDDEFTDSYGDFATEIESVPVQCVPEE